MGGAERITRLAARAAARQSGRYARIVQDHGAPEREPEALKLEDHMQELNETGHFFDRNCTRPACVKAAEFMNSATAALIAQIAQQGTANA